MTKVLIVDDDALVRKMLRTVLTAEGLQVVGEAEDGDEVLSAIAAYRPDVILIDLQMRRTGGIAAIRQVAALRNGPRCVALTGFGSEEGVIQALEAGAAGFLSKDDDPDTLAGHLRSVAAGHGALGPKAAAAAIRRISSPDRVPIDRVADARSKLALLSAREREVTRLVASLTNSQIGGRLHLSENTVKSHVTSALTKLGLRTRAELAVLAALAGLDTHH